MPRDYEKLLDAATSGWSVNGWNVGADESDGDESDGDESDGDESDGDESDGAISMQEMKAIATLVKRQRRNRKKGKDMSRGDRYDRTYVRGANLNVNESAPCNVLTFKLVGPLPAGRYEFKDTIPENFTGRSLLVNPKFGTNVDSFDLTIGGMPASGNDPTFYAPTVFTASSYNRTIEGKAWNAGGVMKLAVNLTTALVAGEFATLTAEGIRAGNNAGQPVRT